MHGRRFGLLLQLGWLLLASPGLATPLTATVDTSASATELGILAPFPSEFQPVPVSGTIVGDVVIDAGAPVELRADGGNLTLSDATFGPITLWPPGSTVMKLASMNTPDVFSSGTVRSPVRR